MSTKRVVVKRVCDRCLSKKKEVDAATTERIAHNGYRYALDLCEDCSAELYGVFMRWADLGELTGKPSVLDKPTPARTVVLTQPVAVQPTPAVLAAPEPTAPSAPAEPVLPRTAATWSVTNHAKQRMEERGVETTEMLWACERPEKVLEDREGRHNIRQHIRGDLIVAVDHLSRTVLTVKRPSTYDPALAAEAKQQRSA